MEFVLCIRFAFTKIQTAQFIVVAQFVTIPNPSSKTLEGKEENHWVAEGNPSVGPYNACTLGIGRALNPQGIEPCGFYRHTSDLDYWPFSG
jgi:hypothetical protein